MLLLKAVACASAVCTFVPQSGVAAQPASVQELLQAHRRALAALHVRIGAPLETQGTLDGLGQTGTFHRWRSGDDERDDRTLGIRTERTLQLGTRAFVQNPNGDVRELSPVAMRRRAAQAYVAGGAFALHPETAVLLGSARLRDGRDVVQLRVNDPAGDPIGIALDAETAMVDEFALPSGDGVAATDFYDYRVVDGALYAAREVQLDGDGKPLLTQRVMQARGGPISPATFAPLVSTMLDADAPVTLPLAYDNGHVFVRATVLGRPLLFLVDSGSQGIFIDAASARGLSLQPQGSLQVRGAKAMSGSAAPLDRIDFAGASLPVGVVSIADLSNVTYRNAGIDGVLGYPFFAAAEVRIDVGRLALTLSKPGALPVDGVRVALDTQREVPEALARINDSVDGRFVIDTGNGAELLLFHDFVQAHPGLISLAPMPSQSGGRGRFSQPFPQLFVGNQAVGGGSAAVPAAVDRLRFGPFDLYHRHADVLLADSGAFSGTWDAGNIGLPTLANFVVTFDLSNSALYLQKAWNFDDGRYRVTR